MFYFQIPPNSNFSTPVKRVVNDKTAHLRELIVNQKNKKPRFKRHFSSKSNLNSVYINNNYYNNKNNNNNINSYNYNYNKPSTNSIHKNKYENSDYSARGYNNIKHKMFSSPKNKGFVTDELQKQIEEIAKRPGVNFNIVILLNVTVRIIVNY